MNPDVQPATCADAYATSNPDGTDERCGGINAQNSLPFMRRPRRGGTPTSDYVFGRPVPQGIVDRSTSMETL